MFYSEGLRGREWLWLEKEPWRLRAEQRLWKKNEEAGEQGTRGGVIRLRQEGGDGTPRGRQGH